MSNFSTQPFLDSVHQKVSPRYPSFTAFAPATVANVGVGFDILGFAINSIGDRITVSHQNTKGVTIEDVNGILDDTAIPMDAARNTAGVPLLEMIEDLNLDFGFSVKIEKGIPLGSGMGGSAASAVGAVVAAHALLLEMGILTEPLSREQLVRYALEGEAIASGSKHADNVAPCLFGGFTLSRPGDEPDVVALPYPKNLYCVIVHPAFRLDTKEARGVLKPELALKTHIQQSARLVAFVAGLTTSDFSLIQKGFDDILIEPQRAPLIPGFVQVKKAALDAGVLGCSISGAGPSVFAFTESEEIAEHARAAMIKAFQNESGPAGKLIAQGWISFISETGAHIV
jgi:homoserine kinase